MEILPKEVWLHIFSYLDGASLRIVENICISFRDWLDDELFWFHRCKKALATVPSHKPLVTERAKAKAPWKDLFLNLISPYQFLLGCWQQVMEGHESKNNQSHRGTLLKFSILPNLGVIYGYMSEYRLEELSHSFVNVVVIHSDGEFSTHRSVERYPLGVQNHFIRTLDSLLVYRPLDSHAKYLDQVYSSEVMEFNGLGDSTDTTTWVKLHPLDMHSGCTLKPGVFASLYGGAHGEELIHICQLPSENLIVGSKLLGDRNVPYGKHTFVIDLNKPLVLSLAEQESVSRLSEVVPVDPKDDIPDSQPFKIPDGMYRETDGHNYDSCIARYAGKITYAHDDYQDPWWAEAHFVLFSQDVMGILTTTYPTFLVYTRRPDFIF
ncbi:F-box only protein 31-like [Watersipora subatra]|uniref:F-box only protein 31-like n=1 Tax=Watersipora subatra TaxID=2589382 RepID=UPI00355C0F24